MMMDLKGLRLSSCLLCNVEKSTVRLVKHKSKIRQDMKCLELERTPAKKSSSFTRQTFDSVSFDTLLREYQVK